MKLDDLINDLRKMNAQDFNQRRLFNSRAWYFEANPNGALRGDYDDFRAALSKVLDVNPQNLTIVGSAKFGYSLTPSADFKPFSGNSDLDVVVVSPGWFEAIWKQLRAAFVNGYRNARRVYAKEIFHKYVHVKPDHDFNTTYLSDVIKKTDEINRHVATPLGIVHPITYRVYADWADVDAYHLLSTESLKETLK